VSEIRVSAEAPVGAPAELVYRLIADYREHHPKFLPPAFTDLVVEKGGVGAGTVFSMKMKAFGQTTHSRMTVSEPEPGRVLVEADADPSSDLTTVFTVEPAGAASRVRFDTRWHPKGGIAGLMERWLAPRFLRGVYADELRRLDAYAREQVGDRG
jgi:ribosome-associated toxin RatA of RatAB toxin-antitoxin module